MAKTTFSTLPRELRDLIYPYILPERLYLVAPNHPSSRIFYKTNGILLTSRALRIEAVSAMTRLVPSTRFIALEHARSPPLSLAPEYVPIRRKIRHIIILLSCQKVDTTRFDLLPMAGWKSNDELKEVLVAMPGLKEVTFEISWSPAEAYTLLFPSYKTRMLAVLRGVVRGEEFWERQGWEVEARIKDKTRWRNRWGGVVVVRKRQRV
jgi:hypothetical protein